MTKKKKSLIIKPSQWINFHWLIISIGFIFTEHPIMIIPFLIYFYNILDVLSWKFTITEESIEESRGPFSYRHDEVLIFRVKDLRVEEPFLMRLVGLSNVYIISSDQLTPNIKMVGIPNGMKVKKLVKDLTIKAREINKVKEYDIR